MRLAIHALPHRHSVGSNALLGGAEDAPRRAVALPERVTAGAERRVFVAPLYLERAQLDEVLAVPNLTQAVLLDVADHLIAREVGAAGRDAAVPVDRHALPQ